MLGYTPPVLTSDSKLEEHIGSLVTIKGKISETKKALLIGVAVSYGDDQVHRGKNGFATGILIELKNEESFEKSIIQNKEIETKRRRYALYTNLTGTLAETQLFSKKKKVDKDTEPTDCETEKKEESKKENGENAGRKDDTKR